MRITPAAFALRALLALAPVALLYVLLGAHGVADNGLRSAYCLILAAGLLLFAVGAPRALLKERFRPRGGEDMLLLFAAYTLVPAHYLIAAWERRAVPLADSAALLATRWAAVVAFAIGVAGVLWSMRANPYFSAVIRIQRERGHALVTHGPYRFIRHPGYLAFLLAVGASPLALAAPWSALPAGIYAALIVRRTAQEDRFLHENLEGYRDYARRVRYRLVPGIW